MANKARLCAYGSCDRVELPVQLTVPPGPNMPSLEHAAKPKFCSELHAALWILDRLRKQARAAGRGDIRLSEAVDLLDAIDSEGAFPAMEAR